MALRGAFQEIDAVASRPGVSDVWVQDARVRAAAFAWLTEQVEIHGDVLPRGILAEGFTFDGSRVPLVGPQGIFKPRVLHEVPLAITTAPAGPYDDSFDLDGFLRYRYRGEDPGHPDNAGLRTAIKNQLPLVYFHGVVPGKYVAAWPVFVVADNPAGLTFSVAVDDERHLKLLGRENESVSDVVENARRAYVTLVVRVRLHQRAFRERVLQAYRHQCAFCRLRHEELLDAAHIVPDSDPKGEPVVRNGLSLCTLHHAAFDRQFLGLRPDYVIEVREDILREHDGPTLVHAIQALPGIRIVLPLPEALRPDPALLEMRYAKFRHAS
jgi:putative restriction endonuclease